MTENQNKPLLDKDIIYFLSQNTDFFVRHPEQLEALQVNNRNGMVVSLINHQVNVLKERNGQLKNKLSQLISNAAENEKIMSQVFQLTLQLCQISHIANVTKHFSQFVKQSFDSDMFKIVIPEYENLESSASVMCVSDEAEFLSVFKDFIANSTPVCGRLKKDKLTYIFGSKADKVGSSVILPIGKSAEKGLLVFASFDESRFNPEMSTDLLSKLTLILERKFKNTFSQKRDQKDTAVPS
jgi:uncharacterized protein YigA (DUF484 family)